jgi:hypothetical protein
VSFGLLIPGALLALAALIVPVLIHLSRRNEHQQIIFAALRWLRPQPRPRRRLRWSEPLLLALRLALLSVLALWLAQPVQWGGQPLRQWELWAVTLKPQMPAAADSVVERRWLAAGFPRLQQTPPPGPQPIASLLRELDAVLPPADRIRVHVPAQLSGLDGQRLRLSRSVDWQISSGTDNAQVTAADPEIGAVLSVRVTDELASVTPYLRAAVLAWNHAAAAGASAPNADPDTAYRLDLQAVDAPLPAHDHWLLWLVPGPLPDSVRAWIAAGGSAVLDASTEFKPDPDAVVIWRDASGQPLAQAQAVGSGRLVQMLRRLQPAALPQLLEPEFPERLRALYAPPAPAPTVAPAAAHTALTGTPPAQEQARSLQDWLAAALLLLFAVERWFASASRGRA